MSTETPDSANHSPPPAGGTMVASPAAEGPSGESQPQTRPRARRWLDWRVIAVLAPGIVGVLVWRLLPHSAKASTGESSTVSAQTIAVARASRADLFNEVPIPAEFRPYLEVELHAKVSGYVDKIYVDIGDRVKAGQFAGNAGSAGTAGRTRPGSGHREASQGGLQGCAPGL